MRLAPMELACLRLDPVQGPVPPSRLPGPPTHQPQNVMTEGRGTSVLPQIEDCKRHKHTPLRCLGYPAGVWSAKRRKAFPEDAPPVKPKPMFCSSFFFYGVHFFLRGSFFFTGVHFFLQGFIFFYRGSFFFTRGSFFFTRGSFFFTRGSFFFTQKTMLRRNPTDVPTWGVPR